MNIPDGDADDGGSPFTFWGCAATGWRQVPGTMYDYECYLDAGYNRPVARAVIDASRYGYRDVLIQGCFAALHDAMDQLQDGRPPRLYLMRPDVPNRIAHACLPEFPHIMEWRKDTIAFDTHCDTVYIEADKYVYTDKATNKRVYWRSWRACSICGFSAYTEPVPWESS